MIRPLFALLATGLVAVAAHAHFVFVIPDRAGASATVVFSEELAPDDGVDIARASGVKLFVRDATGKDAPVEHTAAKHSLTAKLPGSGPRVVFGSVTYGVIQKGEGKPYLLAYHPKAVVGILPPEKAVVGDKLPAELVPVIDGGKVRFKLLGGGKPVPGAEVTVLKPDATKVKVKTDRDGLTDAVEGAGQFGAWGRYFEPKAGEFGGKKYEEVRHYPTVVVEVPGPELPPLPTAVSSLGAAECGGYLYVYGGHAGKTHSYDTKSVLGTFHRLKLDGGTKWEALPGGPIAQGLALVAHNGKVIRVGGMQPRNAPGSPADNHSLATAARFDPKTNKWEALPDLPAARSSHDAVVVGDVLVVVGGWRMNGAGKESVWHDTALTLDLAAKKPEWKSVPQPFKRRALTAAAVGNKVYVLGGLGADGGDRRTDILDVTAGKWSEGPAIPGADRVAFSPAACTANGRLVLNTSEGPVYRLNTAGDGWEKVGEVAKKRIVARLVPFGGDRVVLVGGAGGGANVDAVEVVKLAAKGEPVADR